MRLSGEIQILKWDPKIRVSQSQRYRHFGPLLGKDDVHLGMFSGISGPYPLNASSKPSPSCDNKNISSDSPNYSQLRTIALNQILDLLSKCCLISLFFQRKRQSQRNLAALAPCPRATPSDFSTQKHSVRHSLSHQNRW